MEAVTEQDLRGLTSEKILGLGELEVKEFSSKEREAIISELRIYAGAKNENIPAVTIQAWMILFSALNISVYEIIKRIRMACIEKKYGVSEFATFINADIREYSDLFKFKKREQITENIPDKTEYVKPIVEHPHLQKEKYDIIYTAEKTHYIKNDEGYEVHYPKEYFKLI